ncbi:MAG: MurR/RpiR family transcriptional regulator [Burkholderiaceae bacterium]|nr:MurR/RpiR family transcriptional regulator [Rhodoferax sp.]MCP5284256.1 MurR/RpiR family transcriptional regulator [Burkholderiaceae bacterium]
MLPDMAFVEQRLDEQFDSLSPELQRAARWLRQNGPAVAVHSMRQSARLAGVAPVTMTRLARRLGFADFDSLRAPYARRLVSGHATSSRRRPATRANGLSGQLGALNGAQIAHVGAVTAHNPAPALQAAAKALLRAQRVGFLGQRISHGVAFQLHYGYGLLAPNGVLLGDLGGTLADQLATLGNGTVLVAISQSPYTRSVVEAVARAHQQGAAVVALTDSPLSPIARGAAHTLLYGGGAPALLHSTCGALALAEALLVAVAHAGGTTVQTHWAQRQRQLAQDRAYHESPKDTP